MLPSKDEAVTWIAQYEKNCTSVAFIFVGVCCLTNANVEIDTCSELQVWGFNGVEIKSVLVLTLQNCIQ